MARRVKLLAERRSELQYQRYPKAMAIDSEVVFNKRVGKRLLNVREAAQYLGLKVDTVYKKSRLRELPAVKVGRALRFDIEALDRFIEQHTIKTID
jgi:excisionase family DNA binding protein